MAKLFPFRPTEGPEVESEPRLVNIDDEAADDVFAALSSDTARTILSRLYEEPATASDVADAVDTSLQNARYHLDKLQSAGLVEQVDTWYSSRGTEMTVYAPTSEPLVVAAGEEESRSIIRNALKRVVGAIGVLGIASVAVDRLARRFGTGLPSVGDEPAGREDPGSVDFQSAEGTPAATETSTPADDSTELGADAQDVATETATDGGVEAGAPPTTGTPVETSTPESTGTPPVDAEGTGGVGIQEVTRTVERTRDAPSTTATEPSNEMNTTFEEATRTTAEAASSGFDLGTISPGLLFFAGGLLAVTLAVGWWYWFSYRPMYAD